LCHHSPSDIPPLVVPPQSALQKARESGLFALKVVVFDQWCDGTKPVSFFCKVALQGAKSRKKAPWL